MLKRIIAALSLTLLASPAFAQSQSVRQSGNVTQRHAVMWTASGAIQDAGTAAEGFLSSIGVTASGSGICQNSDKITAAGWQQICFGATTAGGGYISVQNFGTATAQALSFIVNGIPQSFPSVLLPTVANGNACFSNTTGTIKECTTSFIGDSGSGGTLGLVPAPGGGTGASGFVLRASGSFGLAGNGKIRGIMSNSPAADLSWNLYDAYGTSISNAGSQTGGLQEFFTSCFQADSVINTVGHDCEWAGGQEPIVGGTGGGARIIQTTVPIAVGPGSGKVVRAGATSLFATTNTCSLTFNSQIMGNIRLDGWQAFNSTAGVPVLCFKPTATALTVGQAILDTSFSITTVGSVLFDSTGPGGYIVSRLSINELNGEQDRNLSVTVTIATPAVFTAGSSHGMVTDTQVIFVCTTVCTFPTGITLAAGSTTTSIRYYVIATGLTSTQFEVSATPGGAAINTSGSPTGLFTVQIKQQSPYGLSAPTPPSGGNMAFSWIDISHLHDIGPGKDAFKWGDGAIPGGVLMSGNTFKLNISTSNVAANGIHTYAPNNLYLTSIDGITSGKSIWFEPGACGNIVINAYNSAYGTITDSSGCGTNAGSPPGNILIGNGRISIATLLVPTINGAIASGNLPVADSTGVSFADSGLAPGTIVAQNYTATTWTPTLIGSSSGSWVLSTASGSYERIGRQVTVRFNIIASSSSTPIGNIQIGGLPVASSAASGDFGTCTISYQIGLTNTASFTLFAGLINPGGSVILLTESGSAQTSQVAAVGRAGSTPQIVGMCSYHT